MRSISSAIQALINADVYHPLTAVVITLNDGTVLRIADRAATIDGDPYAGDLVEPPRMVISAEGGIDHTEIRVSNADNAYSAYDNDDLFDGAAVVVSQYFADDETYAVLQGPVFAFGGVVSQPTTGADGYLSITVMADARVAVGNIGRTITGRCMNEFRDANCGYTHSGVVLTAGTYSAGNWIPLDGTLLDGQTGTGAFPLWPSSDRKDRVIITRGGSTIYGGASDVFVTSTAFASGAANIKLDTNVTLQVGDKIEYAECPRDSMQACLMRWQVGSTSNQSHKWAGMDYLNRVNHATVRMRYPDIVGRTVPIAYGTRWVEPLLMGAHLDTKGGDDTSASMNGKKGPFVVALISEGPVDEGISDVETDIELDGELLSRLPFYKSGVGAGGYVDVKEGTPDQAVSLLAPLGDRGNGGWADSWGKIAALSAMPHVAYAIIHLPEDYEIAQPYREVVQNKPGYKVPSSGWGTGIIPPSQTVTRYSLTRPGLRVKVKGRKVYTWSLVGGVPTKSGSATHSTNPVWLILDALTATYRTATSDAWASGIDESELDLGSFISAAEYCDEDVTVYDSAGNQQAVKRFTASIYTAEGSRENLIQSLLGACRGSLVAKGSKVGISVDAPHGGKGTVSSATTTSITDSRRSSLSYPAVPSWPTGGANGSLAGMKVKFLTGAYAGSVRTITASTADSVTFTPALAGAPAAGTEYAIYAVELTVDNSGGYSRRKLKASHELTNRLIVNFESFDHSGQRASIPIADTAVDDSGNTHMDRFGLNEESVDLPATTTWHEAIRHGWYHLRKGLDTNREFVFQDVNVEAFPLEVGDIVLVSHDIDGVSNEVLQVTRIEETGERVYSITARLYREHIHADWPTDDFESLSISSELVAPHSVPPHVTNLDSTTIQESENDNPTIKVTWDLPKWPYSGWSVIVEARYTLSGGGYSDWIQVATSRTGSAVFPALAISPHNIRATFVSHVGVRADASLYEGTSTGSNTTTTLNDTSRAWEVDGLVGWAVATTAGTGSGQESTITENAASELTFSPAMSPAPDDTTEYKVYVPAPEIQEDVEQALTSGVPVLDEDDGDLFLYPNYLRAKSCRYIVDAVASDRATVIATGTLSTDAEINVYTFVSDPETAVVSIAYFTDVAGTKGASQLFVRDWVFSAGNDRPSVVAYPFTPDTPGYEGVRLVARDDSNQVNVGYCVLDDGDPEPTWPGDYTTSGLVADPAEVEAEVARPVEGGTRKAVWYQAEDADGYLAYPEGAKVIYIDGNARPSGWFTVAVDKNTGSVKVIPNTDDSDTGSWRFAVVKRTIGDPDEDTFVEPSGAGGEYSGDNTSFGVPVAISGVALARNEVLLVAGLFYRTTATTWASQNASMKSEMSYERGDQGVEHANSIKSAWLEAFLMAQDVDPPPPLLIVYAFWNLADASATGSLGIVTTKNGAAYASKTVNSPAKDGQTLVASEDVLEFAEYAITVTPYTGADLGGTAGEAVQYTLDTSRMRSTSLTDQDGGQVVGPLVIDPNGSLAGTVDEDGNLNVSLRLTVGTDAVGTLAPGELYGRHA